MKTQKLMLPLALICCVLISLNANAHNRVNNLFFNRKTSIGAPLSLNYLKAQRAASPAKKSFTVKSTGTMWIHFETPTNVTWGTDSDWRIYVEDYINPAHEYYVFTSGHPNGDYDYFLDYLPAGTYHITIYCFDDSGDYYDVSTGWTDSNDVAHTGFIEAVDAHYSDVDLGSMEVDGDLWISTAVNFDWW